MNRLIKKFMISSLLLLSGCVSTFPWFNGGATPKLELPYRTFDYGGTSVYYRDLSSPCDTSSVTWSEGVQEPSLQAGAVDGGIDCSIARNESPRFSQYQQWSVETELSISFAMREKVLNSDSNKSDFLKLQDYQTGSAKFQIYGAAGFEGERAERLGLARAKYVRGRLMEMGVGDERISIMPYDPTIPGLQAVVKILGAVVL